MVVRMMFFLLGCVFLYVRCENAECCCSEILVFLVNM